MSAYAYWEASSEVRISQWSEITLPLCLWNEQVSVEIRAWFKGGKPPLLIRLLEYLNELCRHLSPYPLFWFSQVNMYCTLYALLYFARVALLMNLTIGVSRKSLSWKFNYPQRYYVLYYKEECQYFSFTTQQEQHDLCTKLIEYYQK